MCEALGFASIHWLSHLIAPRTLIAMNISREGYFDITSYSLLPLAQIQDYCPTCSLEPSLQVSMHPPTCHLALHNRDNGTLYPIIPQGTTAPSFNK